MWAFLLPDNKTKHAHSNEIVFRSSHHRLQCGQFDLLYSINNCSLQPGPSTLSRQSNPGAGCPTLYDNNAARALISDCILYII